METDFKVLLIELRDLTVYVVDGDYVRNNICIEYCLGGHDLVYYFIPPKEIWIELLPSKEDMFFNLYHELTERTIMEKDPLSYEQAHQYSSLVEKTFRVIFKSIQELF